jgi:hypothetical protein
MRLNDLPLDLLQETSTTLDHYLQARRKARLHREREYLADELRDTRTHLAEIQTLAGATPEREYLADELRDTRTHLAEIQTLAGATPGPFEEKDEHELP